MGKSSKNIANVRRLVTEVRGIKALLGAVVDVAFVLLRGDLVTARIGERLLFGGL